MAEFRGKLYPHQEAIVGGIIAHEAAGKVTTPDGTTIISNTVVVSAPRGCGKKTAVVALIVRSEIPPARPWNVYGGGSGCILTRGGPFWRQNLIISGAPVSTWLDLFTKYAPWLRVLAIGDGKQMKVFNEHIAAGTIAHFDVLVVRAADYTVNHKRTQITDGVAGAVGRMGCGGVFARVIYANVTNPNIRLFNALRNVFIGLPPQKCAAAGDCGVVMPLICCINDDNNIRDYFTIKAAPALQLPGILCYKCTRASKRAALADAVRSFGVADPGVNPAMALANCLARVPVGSAKTRQCETCHETTLEYILTCCGCEVCRFCAARPCRLCHETGTAVKLRAQTCNIANARPLHDKLTTTMSIIAGESIPGAVPVRLKLGDIMCCDGPIVPPKCRKVLVVSPQVPLRFPEMRGSASDRAAAMRQFRCGADSVLIVTPADCTGYDLDFVTDIIVYGRKKDTIIQVLGCAQRISRVYSVTLWIIDTPDDLISVRVGV